MSNNTEPFVTSEISAIEVGQLDSRYNRRFTNFQSKNPGGGIRGEIRELSRQSRTRLIYSARNMPGLKSMITFTYPSEEYAPIATGGDFMTEGKVVKEHLRKIRQMLTYRGIYGFWFLEFQKRGAPHFHFFTDAILETPVVEKMKRTWAKMVGTNCPHHPERGMKYEILRKKEAAGAYAAKYSSKDEQKIVPDHYKNVGRFWGTFGKVPKSQASVTLPLKEMHELVRIARNAQKAYARDRGIKFKARDLGNGSGGATLYNTGLALRYYLLRKYTVLEETDPASIRIATTYRPF